MFISNSEKENIHTGMLYLHSELAKLKDEIFSLSTKIKVLEEKNLPKLPKPTEEELKEELKKAQKRAYGKAYYQRKKEREQVLNVGS